MLRFLAAKHGKPDFILFPEKRKLVMTRDGKSRSPASSKAGWQLMVPSRWMEVLLVVSASWAGGKMVLMCAGFMSLYAHGSSPGHSL